ncbi:hypothetical protein LCGC14_0552360 [marine sediment metagenome]|uniref:Uncharacterized protein n=1 Tax=marine sediment metagenome TaxID=412755 RepID=A0A0F9UXT8_9ZZZZ
MGLSDVQLLHHAVCVAGPAPATFELCTSTTREAQPPATNYQNGYVQLCLPPRNHQARHFNAPFNVLTRRPSYSATSPIRFPFAVVKVRSTRFTGTMSSFHIHFLSSATETPTCDARDLMSRYVIAFAMLQQSILRYLLSSPSPKPPHHDTLDAPLSGMP